MLKLSLPLLLLIIIDYAFVLNLYLNLLFRQIQNGLCVKLSHYFRCIGLILLSVTSTYAVHYQ